MPSTLTYEQSLFYIVQDCKTVEDIERRLDHLIQWSNPDMFCFIEAEREHIMKLYVNKRIQGLTIALISEDPTLAGKLVPLPIARF
ncbi:hypothetical protein HY500_01135 [Candidatus Woesearchaeota archaeon]|nr:hypothetical protein [Candidatus Woesearchaeota archaeon]